MVGDKMRTMSNTRMIQGGVEKIVRVEKMVRVMKSMVTVLNKMVVGEVLMLLEWEVLMRLMR